MASLVEAVKAGRLEDVQAAVKSGGDVDESDQDGWTALTSAAADGRSDILDLLLAAGADINHPNRWEETALSRAVFGGHVGAARLLIDKGAAIDVADEDGDTPLHVAVISKRLDLACLLLERNADGEVRNKDRMTALETAQRYGQRDFVAVLQDYRSSHRVPGKMWRVMQSVGGYVSYLVGIAEPEGEAAPTDTDDNQVEDKDVQVEQPKTQSDPEKSVLALLPVLLELCAGMVETQNICEDMLERLQRVQLLLDEKESVVSARTRVSFELIVTRFHAFLVQHSKQTSVERLASTRTILGLLREFHHDIDEVIARAAPADSSSILTNWKDRWNDAVLAVENRLVGSWEANSSELSRELPDKASQTGALLLLNSETVRHKSRYSARSQELLRSASKRIARMSGAPIPEIPEWFVPRHEVQRQARPFASGSYGKVYRGIWRGSKVVIKCMRVSSPFEKKAFLREARIWHKARHPHVVNFFGACYNSHPCFFICEEAANGNLVDYLQKRKDAKRTLIWKKLHEAALGLEYLHQNDIIHGDLKCNQILVTGEGVAKLTDFGFSFVLSESKPSDSGGATRWRAPECLGFSGQMPTFESDVYSFGMCVIEAITNDVPWGVYLPDAAVVDHLRHQEFISRPQQFTCDAEWQFVLALCAFKPSRRIELSDAIKQLERFAEGLSTSGPSLWTMPAGSPERTSKQVSLKRSQDDRKAQLHDAAVKILYTVLAYTARTHYLRYRRAVLTIQVAFRYKKYRQRSACALQRFLRMACQRRKYLRFLRAVHVLQCRFRYRQIFLAKAQEYTSVPDADVKSHRKESVPGTQSTQSSWWTKGGSDTSVSEQPPGTTASNKPQDRRFTEAPSTPANRSPWVNDEDRFRCCVCNKDFTMFRRKHHCRVCFEIICSNCSLTRKKMRVCVVCAGIRSPADPLSTATQTQTHRRGGFLSNAGEFFTNIGTRMRSERQNVGEATTYTPFGDEEGSTFSSKMAYPNDQFGQHGLWEDNTITAARIPRNSVMIHSIISRGSYGLVHLGTWNGMHVAVKTLLPESRKSVLEINQFLAEAKMIAAMEHPCIVNLIGVAWDSLADVCMVVEYMDGGDLRSMLSQYHAANRPIGFSVEKLRIALSVCEALTYLHSLSPPVLHRDLKSRNILLNSALEAKVTDFGVSREAIDRTMTAGVGTSFWMAPEVIMGEAYNEKADIFSFGIVLSELDRHSLPYQQNLPALRVLQMVVSGSLRAEFSGVGPQAVKDLGNACISLDPANRPSAAEAMYILHSVLREFT